MLPDVPKGSHRIPKAYKGSTAAAASAAAAAAAAGAAAAAAVKPNQTPKAGATSASARSSLSGGLEFPAESLLADRQGSQKLRLPDDHKGY